MCKSVYELLLDRMSLLLCTTVLFCMVEIVKCVHHVMLNWSNILYSMRSFNNVEQTEYENQKK